ncbi:MAG TPA: hypothetical protein VK742_10830 [Candidatus Sulfotelmatobacter sp.]|jgi:hypothetical protein|nr:hypothetical protein [Candidatus Sulfotelmatobacter sp.]
MTSITIGAIFGGGELSGTPIERALRGFSFPPDDSLPFSLNVIFHVPGSIFGDLDYVGVRTAKFSRKQKKLMIQIAVPKEMIHSPSVRVFLFSSVREAVVTATPYLRKKGVEYPAQRVLDIVRMKEEAG